MSELATNVHEYSVSEISGAVKNCVEDAFSYVRIRGEVGRLSRPASGHIYFDLKDDKAVISAVSWKGVASRWKFQPEQGLEVIVTGRLTTFPGQSKYQIIVESVEPAGVGALMALLEERRKKLAKEGLFDDSQKKELPFLPKTIGVITSPSGAVIRDILHRLEDRFPTNVIVWPVRVQGETCAKEVANALKGFNALETGGEIARPDLIIVARGGGSVEDLWGFNEEDVVRAVADSEIPIISAIGHETDTTLIDYVADKRAPTPTGAAEIAVPVRIDLVAYVVDLGGRARNGVSRQLANSKDRVRGASAGLPRPSDLLMVARQRLDFALEKLSSSLHKSKDKKALILSQTSARLINPKTLVNIAIQRVNGLSERLVGGLRSIKQQKALMLIKSVSGLSLGLSKSKENKSLLFSKISARLISPRTSINIYVQRVEGLGERLSGGLMMVKQQKALMLAKRTSRLSIFSLVQQKNELREKIARVDLAMPIAFSRLLKEKKQRLISLNKLLENMSHKSVLQRGFALITDAKDNLVRNGAGLKTGDRLNISFADVKKAVIVEGEQRVSIKKPVVKKTKQQNDNQSSLF